MNNLTRREREKQMREEEIIKAAEKIFCEKGFEETSMDEIAKEAEFTKRTLYQYFANKEELYFAVALNSFKSLGNYFQKVLKTENTGYEKIQAAFEGFYMFYKGYPKMFKVIGYLGSVKKKSEGDSKGKKAIVEFNSKIFKSIASVIAEGQEDGSISADLDGKKTTASLIFLMTGFFSQLSVSGETFLDAFSLELEDFSHLTMDLILKGIKA